MLKNVRASLLAAVLIGPLFLVAGCGSSPSSAKSAVTITSPSLPNGTYGVAYNAAIQAANGIPPYTFSLASGSIPGGLTLTSGGTLSGTPTGSGNFSFTVAVTDSAQGRATQSFSVSIAAAVTVSPSALPNGTVGTAYTANLSASNGATPYTFSVTAGKLPDGLTLNAGAISGTPMAAGTFNFTITATDASSQRGSQAYTVVIAPMPVSITQATLASGEVGVAYSATIGATNGTTPYSFALSNNTSLPAGLTLASNGAISGTPSAAGTTSFQVTVTDAASKTSSAAFSITIAPTVTITAATLPTATAGAAYTASIAATGGTTPYSFALSNNTSLPAGLSLASDGSITGTPATAGTTSFQVTVTDAKGQTSTQTYSITVVPAGSTIKLANTNFGVLVNTNYTGSLGITGGTGPYTVTRTGGNFPSGLTLAGDGTISGKATATGAYTFPVQITDNSSPQQTQTATVTINVVDATVGVDTTKPIAVVPSTFYGLHTSIYDGKLNDYSGIAPWLAKTNVSVLRYPGGGYADNYHWAQNIITPFGPTTAQPVCGVLSNGSVSPVAHFGNFVKLLQATKTQALITVNYGTSLADANATRKNGSDGQYNCSEPNTYGQPEEAAAWVAYANGDPSNTTIIGKDAAGFDWKTVGYWAGLRAATPLGSDDGYNFLRLGQSAPVGVKFWEIGNEVYYNGWTNNINAETDMHAPYVYSNGVFDGGYDSRAGLGPLSPTSYGQYAVPFIQKMKQVDPNILIGIDFASPGATDPIDLSFDDSLAKSACSLGAFDIAIIHYYPGTWKDVQPGELLTLPQSDLPYQVAWIKKSLNQYCSNAANIQFMLTETAPNDKLDPAFPAPVMGLFVLNDMMSAVAQNVQNFDWLELHSHSNVDPYNTFLDDGENPSYAYYGFVLANLLASPGDSTVQATSSSGTLVSYASLKANGQKGVVLINNDATNSKIVQVTVSGATVGASATQYSYGINTTQNGGVLSSTPLTLTGNSFAVTVPAYTAVEVIVP